MHTYIYVHMYIYIYKHSYTYIYTFMLLLLLLLLQLLLLLLCPASFILSCYHLSPCCVMWLCPVSFIMRRHLGSSCIICCPPSRCFMRLMQPHLSSRCSANVFSRHPASFGLIWLDHASFIMIWNYLSLIWLHLFSSGLFVPIWSHETFGRPHLSSSAIISLRVAGRGLVLHLLSCVFIWAHLALPVVRPHLIPGV